MQRYRRIFACFFLKFSILIGRIHLVSISETHHLFLTSESAEYLLDVCVEAMVSGVFGFSSEKINAAIPFHHGREHTLQLILLIIRETLLCYPPMVP